MVPMNDTHQNPLFAALNPAQQEALHRLNGPVMIVAGAGSGKTRVLTQRIAHLIATGVPPETILGITFTNKAAREMRDRVRALLFGNLAPSAREPLLATFHSLGVRILREFAPQAGLPRSFSIYDRADSLKIVKDSLRELGAEKQWEPRALLSAISRAKGDATTLSAYRDRAATPFEEIVVRVWERYENALQRTNALDFDDLLSRTLLLVESQTEIQQILQERWRYIHVDEFQDTNAVQYRLLRLLVGKEQNICVVGDVDQNIYSWRGASIRFMLNFESDFPGAAQIILEENYRSTQTIVAAANELISRNRNRIPKVSHSTNEEGSPVRLYAAYDEHDEAAFVARTIRERLQEGVASREIAVLYRANFQSRVLEEALLRVGVPYKVVGTRFFERKEVKDILSYARAALNPQSTADIARIANTPPRGIGKATLAALLAEREHTLAARARNAVASLRRDLKAVAAVLATEPASHAIRHIMELTGYLRMLEASKSEEDKERAENLKELVSLAAEYDHHAPPAGIEEMLAQAALESDQDTLRDNHEGVALMTVHAAKGLEFAEVFVVGLEEGLFPSYAGLNDASRDEEEERRLMYVAMTRAQKQLWLSWAQSRMLFGNRSVQAPSSFLSEIDPSYLEPVQAEEEAREPLRVIYLDE